MGSLFRCENTVQSCIGFIMNAFFTKGDVEMCVNAIYDSFGQRIAGIGG